MLALPMRLCAAPSKPRWPRGRRRGEVFWLCRLYDWLTLADYDKAKEAAWPPKDMMEEDVAALSRQADEVFKTRER